MANKTLTAVNSTFNLVVANLFPAPVKIEGYASDNAFTIEAVNMAEVQMGVDGKMSYGYVPNPVTQTVHLQADSPSIDVFDAWINFIKANKDQYRADAVVTIRSVGKKYTLTNGVLTSAQQMPGINKILAAHQYIITWESVIAEAI